jgi:MraZ protein
MSEPKKLLIGEFRRSLDERFRLSIPAELLDQWGVEEAACLLSKERPGCVSLWLADEWERKLNEGIELVRSKLRAGRFQDRVDQVQLLGRLLSTRHKEVQLSERGRVLIPEGFREFLRVEPGSEVMVVGAAVCVEIWRPAAWLEYLEVRMPRFQRLFDRLSS